MKALVVAGAPVIESPLVAPAIATAEFRVAADSGAEALLARDVLPDLVVGDFDSLDPAARELLLARGVPLVSYPARKDRTDLHIAIYAAMDRGASDITFLGLLGGPRTDHGLAAMLLLARDEFAGVRLRVIDGYADIQVARRDVTIQGRPGDYVSLVSLAPRSEGVSTEGLEYRLTAAALTFGDSLGVSNVLEGETASVHVGSGVVLVVHQHTPEINSTESDT